MCINIYYAYLLSARITFAAKQAAYTYVSLSQWQKRKHEPREKSVAKYDRNYSIHCGCSKVLKLATTDFILF